MSCSFFSLSRLLHSYLLAFTMQDYNGPLISHMAIEAKIPVPKFYKPVQTRNGGIEFSLIHQPLPPDTRPPLLRHLKENQDIFGFLHRYAEPAERLLTPIQEQAELAIQTLIGLRMAGQNPIPSLYDEVFVLLHFLTDSQKAANKAAFLQQEFGVRYPEAGFVEYPLRDAIIPGYQLFTKATELYQRAQQAESPQEGPTWLDMHVLVAYQTLLEQNNPATAFQIHKMLISQEVGIPAIAASLKKLEAMGEITRLPTRKRGLRVVPIMPLIHTESVMVLPSPELAEVFTP